MVYEMHPPKTNDGKQWKNGVHYAQKITVLIYKDMSGLLTNNFNT